MSNKNKKRNISKKTKNLNSSSTDSQYGSFELYLTSNFPSLAKFKKNENVDRKTVASEIINRLTFS